MKCLRAVRVGLLAALAALSASCRSTWEFPGFEGGLGTPVPTPVDVDAVVFLVGDAGNVESGRSPVIERLRADVEYWSRELGRDSAVSVVFLGDNVYPYGVRDRDHPGFPQDSARLWNQVDVVAGPAAIRHHTVGLFVPGNHDWSNAAGEDALVRIGNQERELERARATGPLVALLPEAGRPGPVVRDLRRNVRLVFFDSQWFLRETSERARTEFLRDLGTALETAGDREVVLLSHHPYATAGPHGIMAGGPASVGALYLLSKSGALIQDLNSPAYGSLRARMRATFERSGEVPLIYAAGHDHSLQVLEGREPGDPRNILVSGSASKLTSIGDTIGMRYGAVRPGYMMLLFRLDDTVDLYVTAGDPKRLSCPAEPEAARIECMNAGLGAFELAWSGTLPRRGPDDDGEAGGPASESPDSLEEKLAGVEAPPRAVPEPVRAEERDSIVATPGRTYTAGRLHRTLMGDLNRDLWSIPIAAPVLDLDTVAGGLAPLELSGTDEAPCLEMQGRDGRIYEFRPIVRNTAPSAPDPLESAAAEGQAQDQLGALFPLGERVAAELLRTADVLVALPRLVVMPDDPRLGPFREVFSGRMGWITPRPEDGEGSPGFAGSTDIEDTAGMLEALRTVADMRVDERAFLRARLVDMFVNDWNHPTDGWRWAAFPDSAGVRWEPIPGECQWAFARVDGLIPRVAGAVNPEYVGFSESYADVARIMRAGIVIDRRLLGAVDRRVFIEEALALQQAFSDSAIDAAIRTLPEPIRIVEQEPLATSLRARRNELPRIAEEYYRLMAGTADVYGTLDSDSLHLAVGPYSVTATLWRGEDRVPGFSRTFRRGETTEARVYLGAGEDVVTVTGASRLPMKVRLIGEPASVRLIQPGRSELLVEEGSVSQTEELTYHEADLPAVGDSLASAAEAAAAAEAGTATTAWETRDWGSEWLVRPALSYASEFGLHVGLGVSRLGFAFRQTPWQSRLTAQAMTSGNPFRLIGQAAWERRLNLFGFGGRIEFAGHTRRHSRFFGLGNQSRSVEPESYYTAFRPYLRLDASLLYRSPQETWSVWIGPRLLHWGEPEADGNELILRDSSSVYGRQPFTTPGLQAGFEIDAVDESVLPHAGIHARIEARGFAAPAGLRSPWAGATGALHLFQDLPGPLDPVLHLRFTGERVWGSAPYPELASLGGLHSLPGYLTGRFLGNSAASASALVRVSLFDVHALGGLGVGTFAIGATGRVWLDGVSEPRTQHMGAGAGLFVRIRAIGRTASLTFVRGDRATRAYLALGLPF